MVKDCLGNLSATLTSTIQGPDEWRDRVVIQDFRIR